MWSAENGAIRLKVKVIANAKKSEIVRSQAGELVVKLNAVPEDGRANRALCELLAKLFAQPKSAVAIVSGAASHHKVVRLTNTDEARILLAKLTQTEL